MAFTSNERALIAASDEGTEKLAEIDRMNATELDNRFCAAELLDEDGNPASQAAKDAERTRWVTRFVNYNASARLRARVNVLGFVSNIPTLSPDNDYVTHEQNTIKAYAKGIVDRNSNPNDQTAYKALDKMDDMAAELDTLLSTNNLNNRRKLVRSVMRM